ncbi:MAG: class I SAM-dependent methyltransferase [Clostridia bacterium]|nr:class I SAM-dependent methyltransferase [Clostridia bacterium]
MRCNLCGSIKIRQLGNIGEVPVSVTSDSKLCKLFSEIYYCCDCMHVQKLYNHGELEIIRALYNSYEPHYLSNGVEQLAFNGLISPKTRTYHVLEQCASFLPESGELLDVGSGNGAVLKSASQLLPRWTLNAFDIVEIHKEQILKIPNVVNFTSGKLENLPAKNYNLIILWHVLEHVPNPCGILSQLREKLLPGGILLIQVPDLHRNPFDLAVIDHCSHFMVHSLLKLIDSTGFELIADGCQWIYNCITFAVKVKQSSMNIAYKASVNYPFVYYNWLNENLKYFKVRIEDNAYSIFGTGMASIYLFGQMEKRPMYFIDEDSGKRGKCIDGIPIVKPEDVPEQSNIIMPFTYETGKELEGKMRRLYKICSSQRFILSLRYEES